MPTRAARRRTRSASAQLGRRRRSRAGRRRRARATRRTASWCPCGDHSTSAARRPDTGSMIVSSPREVRRAEVDLDLLAHDPEPVARLVVGHHDARVELLAARLDRAQHGPRRVVAPDALQAVGDLALPIAVDDDDQVEYARGGKRLVGRVALAQQLAERGLDRVRGGVALGPDVLGSRRPSPPRPVALTAAATASVVEQRIRLGGRRIRRVLGDRRARVVVPRGRGSGR